jgi:hypothetical protein
MRNKGGATKDLTITAPSTETNRYASATCHADVLV